MKAREIIIIGIALLLAFLYFDSCKKRKQDARDNTNLINAIQDTLIHFKNKDGDNVARIATLQTENTSAFLKLSLKDSQLIALQKVVEDNKAKLKKPGSSATTATISTTVKNTNPTTITKTDTVRVDSLVYLYPTYEDSLSNKWIEYRAKMNKDSATFSIDVKNDFNVVIGYSKGKPYAELTTMNPYTTVKSFRTFQVQQPKPKKWGIGLSGGVTLNTQTFKPAPYIGAGINYNLIRL